MALLRNKTKNIVLSERLEIANTIWTRTKGLLGRKDLPTSSALWIRPCSSIHTWFMQFPIDVAFVDKKLKVTRIHKNIRPWRLVLSTFVSESVFEFNAGTLTDKNVEIGDQLHVDS